MSLRLLEGIGLTKKEIDIYETLLKNGETLPGVIIKQTGLKRATVYKALYALEEKGLVIQRKVDGKATFIPEPPSKLLEQLERRMTEEKKVLDGLKDILPALNQSYIFSLEQPIITVNFGIDGLKAIYLDSINTGKPIRMSVTSQNVEVEFLKWIDEVYVPNRVAAGVSAKMLVTAAPWLQYFTKFGEEYLSEVIVVPQDQIDFEYSVGIFGDKVNFINYSSNQTLVGITVQHPLIAKTMETWFDKVWEHSKK
jgi:sugar-specific transcriptional regulator TrmB